MPQRTEETEARLPLVDVGGRVLFPGLSDPCSDSFYSPSNLGCSTGLNQQQNPTNVASSPETTCIASRVRRITVIGIHGWAPFGGALTGVISVQPQTISKSFCLNTTDALLKVLKRKRMGIPIGEETSSSPNQGRAPNDSTGRILDNTASVTHEETKSVHSYSREQNIDSKHKLIDGETSKKNESASETLSAPEMVKTADTGYLGGRTGDKDSPKTRNEEPGDICFQRIQGDISPNNSIVVGKGDLEGIVIKEIPLASFGKVNDRLKEYTIQMEAYHDWLMGSDLVVVACHSQGSIVAGLLLARLAQAGTINFNAQLVCCLSMAGVHHGPYPDIQKDGFRATKELFLLHDVDTEIAIRYREEMTLLLRSGLKLFCIGAWMDEAVPLHSALFHASHLHQPMHISSAIFGSGTVGSSTSPSPPDSLGKESDVDVVAQEKYVSPQVQDTRIYDDISVDEEGTLSLHAVTVVPSVDSVTANAPEYQGDQKKDEANLSQTPFRSYRPNIVRALYIAESNYVDDFLTKLVSLSIHVRNLGFFCDILVHLSGLVRGSILWGGQHTVIHKDHTVYETAISWFLSQPTVSHKEPDRCFNLDSFATWSHNFTQSFTGSKLNFFLIEKRLEYLIRLCRNPQVGLEDQVTELIASFHTWKPKDKILSKLRRRLLYVMNTAKL